MDIRHQNLVSDLAAIIFHEQRQVRLGVAAALSVNDAHQLAIHRPDHGAAKERARCLGREGQHHQRPRAPHGPRQLGLAGGKSAIAAGLCENQSGLVAGQNGRHKKFSAARSKVPNGPSEKFQNQEKQNM